MTRRERECVGSPLHRVASVQASLVYSRAIGIVRSQKPRPRAAAGDCDRSCGEIGARCLSVLKYICRYSCCWMYHRGSPSVVARISSLSVWYEHTVMPHVGGRFWRGREDESMSGQGTRKENCSYSRQPRGRSNHARQSDGCQPYETCQPRDATDSPLGHR